MHYYIRSKATSIFRMNTTLFLCAALITSRRTSCNGLELLQSSFLPRTAASTTGRLTSTFVGVVVRRGEAWPCRAHRTREAPPEEGSSASSCSCMNISSNNLFLSTYCRVYRVCEVFVPLLCEVHVVCPYTSVNTSFDPP